MRVVLDIETVPLLESLDAEYPVSDRQPPANYKSDEAIATWRDTDKAKWASELVKTCSLNPRLGRVLCLGWQVLGDDTVVTYAADEAEERLALMRFWELMENAQGRVVTWNGSFDLRFLLIRSLVHGVEPTVAPAVIRGWFRKYQSEPHTDVKMLLLNWPSGYPSGEGLDEWATALSIGGKLEGMSGDKVYPLYQLGHHDEISRYCASDVEATANLYRRIEPYFVDAHL